MLKAKEIFEAFWCGRSGSSVHFCYPGKFTIPRHLSSCSGLNVRNTRVETFHRCFVWGCSSSHGSGIHSVHSFSFALKHIHEKLQWPWIHVDVPQNFYTFYTPQKLTLFYIPQNFYKKPRKHPFWDSCCIIKWHWRLEFARKKGLQCVLSIHSFKYTYVFLSFCWRHSQKGVGSVLRISTPLETRRC